ncbi:hypothetical protein KDH_08310 [Dictyobacter sp. S3.2.2.5]|uniref:Uncharacterized protein n=1 Tax=Dictyobacter halimunensis TaxID=3026934 RepID=A0ABQ6FLU0_9CHLR|nr:hypothetical protein KDH_08310 [Dictyobacter sp. S3.2.2.5]
MDENTVGSTSTSSGSDLYRVADLEILPAGEHYLLVAVRRSREVSFLRRDVVDLLTHCHLWQTLDAHVQAYSQLRPLPANVLRTLRREVQRLAQRGYLIRQTDLLAELRACATPTRTSQIASIVFPTCERVELLHRGLISYIENTRHFERRNDFVIADDSAASATRADYRQMLATLKARYGVMLSYAGREEKEAYVSALATRGGIPKDIVHFACLGDPVYGLPTIGANRNVLLLHTVGDLILSADDDTVCRVASSPEAMEQLAWVADANPLEAWFFADRAEALRALQFEECDPLVAHEHWLGQPLREAVATYGVDSVPAIEQVDAELLPRVLAQPKQIAVTLNGMVGDCCWDNPDFYLFQSGDTYRRLTRSEQAYRCARGSREMIQAVRRTTLVQHLNALFALCMGLDNRGFLPPFTPLGRGEEIGFVLALTKCVDSAYAVYLNQVIQHLPGQVRTFQQRPLFRLDISSCLPFCIGQSDPGFVHDPTERLRRIGQQVQDIGRLPEKDFEELMRLFIWKSASGFISQLEERLHDGVEQRPSFWRQDAQELILQARQQALQPSEQWYTLKGGAEQLQRVLVRCGQVLEWWPTMVETARKLRAEGLRLAKPIL